MQKVLIAYNLRNELNIEHMYQVDYIPEEYQVGVLNLEVYNNYEDIKEELNNMLNERM